MILCLVDEAKVPPEVKRKVVPSTTRVTDQEFEC